MGCKRICRRMFTLFAVAVMALCLLCTSVYAATTVKPRDGVEVTDSEGTGLLSGTVVTITVKGSLFNKNTNTITISNTSGMAGMLSFDYSVTSANSCTVAGTVITAPGTYSDLVAANGSVTITLESRSGLNAGTATLTLSAFSLKAAAESSNVAVSYDSSLGSVTAGGTAVSNGGTIEVTSSGTALVATAKSGTTFLGWIDTETHQVLSTSASYTLIPMDDMTVQAAFASSSKAWFQCPSGTATYLYDDLNAAGNFAETTSEKKVILANSGTLASGSYTIPSGVTLLIPFDPANTIYTTVPGCLETYTTPTAYRTLTMASGANITVNGSLSVGGAQSAKYLNNGYVTGPVGFIKMNSGSSISVENGANLYAWGYITGSGSVEIKSGGSVYEDFQLSDFRGGDGTSKMASNDYGVFPMSQYYMQNIEAPLTLCAGAKEYAYMSANITLAGIQGTSIPIVSGSNGEAMFKISSGHIVKDYMEGTGRLEFEIHGDVAISPITMTMKLGMLGSTTIKSANFYLPIPGHFTIDTVEGNVTLEQDLALLPGSELYIREGVSGTLGVDTKVVIYDWDDWGGYCGAANSKYIQVGYAPGGNGTTGREKDALIQVDGTLDASHGKVYGTSHGANIYSTGTGVIKAPATEASVAYQAKQSQTSSGTQKVDYEEIKIQPPILRNGDGTYVETGSDTLTYTYSGSGSDGKWLHNGVAEWYYEETVGETTSYYVKPYATLANAVNAYSSGYIRMVANSKDGCTINKTVNLDLNGHTVKNVTLSGTLYGADSATDDYGISSATYGTLTLAQTADIPTLSSVNGKDYVAYQDETGYSFHRVAVAPVAYQYYYNENAHSHMAFQAAFLGDATATSLVQDIGFAVALTGGNGTGVSMPSGIQWYGKTPVFTVTSGQKLFSFVALDYEENAGFGDTYTATAYVAFGDNEEERISKAASTAVSFNDALELGVKEG